MSFSVDQAHVDAFGASVFSLAQQKNSRFRNRVTVETGVVGKSKNYERLGASDMNDVTSRHGDSPLQDIEHSRRRLDFTDKDWGELVDKADSIKTIIDPANAYNRAARKAVGRKIDNICIAVLDGNAIDGAGSTVAFAAGQIVAVDFVEGAGADVNSNMTVGKVREAKGLFMDNDIDDEEPLTAAISGKQIRSLLRDDEVTSSDFSSLQALMAGTIAGMNWMGFHWIRSELLNITGNNRHCNFFTQRGLQLAFNLEVINEMTQRADKRYSWYVYFQMGLGAVRMDELEVVRVLCDETA